MYQLYNTALEAGLCALLLIPLLLIFNRIQFHSLKKTTLYALFAIYLSGVYAVVGLPNISYIRLELNLNIIPFVDMLSDLTGTFLNIVLFVPLGLFLPVLWDQYRHLFKTLIFGFCLSVSIELLQIFTFRATDINDLITNTAGTALGYGLGIILIKMIPWIQCHSKSRDLPVLIALSAAVMFFFQPIFWELIY